MLAPPAAAAADLAGVAGCADCDAAPPGCRIRRAPTGAGAPVAAGGGPTRGGALAGADAFRSMSPPASGSASPDSTECVRTAIFAAVMRLVASASASFQERPGVIVPYEPRVGLVSVVASAVTRAASRSWGVTAFGFADRTPTRRGAGCVL